MSAQRPPGEREGDATTADEAETQFSYPGVGSHDQVGFDRTYLQAAVRTEALVAWDAGLCVVPARNPKRPVGWWKRHQVVRPDRAATELMFAGGHDGLAIVCGDVSGNLELFEFEGVAVAEGMFVEFAQMCDDKHLGLLLNRICAGWSETSPSGGLHLY